MKKIAFLTSSRADFGIYMPLLSKLQEEADIFTTVSYLEVIPLIVNLNY